MMRLTLRTLLAYLDDVLSPADTKLIGQKIQESPMAQLLVSRIREVMRRRRLKAPEVFGPEMGIDPNVVAQYLDNTLPMEQYADVERVLLASDELLAETASCHQVLTLILGESKEVPLTSRERLYALGPVDASSKLSLGSDTSFGTKSKTPESIQTMSGKSGVINTHNVDSKQPVRHAEHATTVPDYLKPTPIWKQLIPATVVVALLGVCAYLAYPLLNEGLEKARTEMSQKAARPSAETVSDSTPSTAGDEAAEGPKEASGESIAANEPETKPAKVEPQDEEALELPPTVAKTSPKVPAGIEPNQAVAEQELSVPLAADSPAVDSEPPVPAEEVAVKPAQPQPSVVKPLPNTVPPAPQPDDGLSAEILADLKVAYTSPDGIMVKLDADRGHWFVVPKASMLNPAERIANLEPFDGLLEFDKSGVRATLVNECIVETLPPSAAGLQGLGIGRGRIILQSAPNAKTERTPFAIAIGKDVWKLELITDDAVCAIEVTVREPVQFEKINPVRWYQASLMSTSGTVKLTTRTGRAVELGELTAIELTPEKGEIARPEPVLVSGPPDWTIAAKRKSSPMRNYLTPFEKAFDLNVPVEDSMLTLVTSTKNPKIAELGAKSLSATDDYTAMVQTLAECTHQEGQAAARDGLRMWLPMNPENGPRLKTALLTHYKEEDAEAAYRMLWGFTREEVQSSKSESLMFTTWMRSQRPEIRKLADYWVERLTGRPNEFNAYGNEKQRDSQIRRIEDQIEKNGGLKSIERSTGTKKGS